MRARAPALAALLLASGCGGGAPLLHPVHALPAGTVTMGAGTSDNFVLGDAHTAIDRARVAIAGQGAVASPQAQRDFAQGAVAEVMTAPGLAPWVGGRAGFGAGDAGLTYTGRSVRVDGRGVTGNEHVAFSAGAGASAILQRPGSHSPTGGGGGDAIPGLDTTDVSGWGLDVPLLVGWRSDASLIQVWAGLRAGYEHASGTVIVAIDPDPSLQQELALSGHRLYGGGLVGFAVGVSPLWVAVELDAAYQSVDGSLGVGPAGQTKLQGLSMAPAGALLAEF